MGHTRKSEIKVRSPAVGQSGTRPSIRAPKIFLTSDYQFFPFLTSQLTKVQRMIDMIPRGMPPVQFPFTGRPRPTVPGSVYANSTFTRNKHDQKRYRTPQEGPDKCRDRGDFSQNHRVGPGTDPQKIGKIEDGIQ